ncbi:hypothetical protein QR680_013790 [Steinernema hermaphroditum]|uniref:SXP/RAL-2 family protein Ani s 5-like cation-binding domain-containing protein n=1 Tax=Steinernema hermaphroditum TaxID=289476 RepID=A0AA39I6P4_9BILA|nr:hypothetical protein QR680_013790 [Steinernema hermaphroditum]
MKLYLLVLFTSSPILCDFTYEGERDHRHPVVPEYHQIFALFMEQSTIDFVISLADEDLEAFKKAKLKAKGKHLTDDEFSALLGNYSKVAQSQFDMLMAENNEAAKHLEGNAKSIIHEMDSALRDMDEEMSRDDLKQWLVDVSEKLRSLSPSEKNSIIDTLPHKGMLLSATGLQKIHNENDAETFIDELMSLYGQYHHDEEHY